LISSIYTMKKPKLKVLKEFEVTISITCYTNIYTQTALQDLQNLLDVFKEVHQEACIMKVTKKKEVKIKA
jgi:hypothetical protein